MGRGRAGCHRRVAKARPVRGGGKGCATALKGPCSRGRRGEEVGGKPWRWGKKLKGRAKDQGAERQKEARGEAQGAASGRDRPTIAREGGAGSCGTREKPLLNPAHLQGKQRKGEVLQALPVTTREQALALSTWRHPYPPPPISQRTLSPRCIPGRNHSAHSSWGGRILRLLLCHTLRYIFVALFASLRPERPPGLQHS